MLLTETGRIFCAASIVGYRPSCIQTQKRYFSLWGANFARVKDSTKPGCVLVDPQKSVEGIRWYSTKVSLNDYGLPK